MAASDTNEPPVADEPQAPSAGWKVSAAISGVILAVAAGLAILTFMTEPTASREGATKTTAMLVEVTAVERGTHRPQIVATGTVEPSQDIVLRPQVAGRIVELAPEFTPGGFVKKGQLLLRIESADYRNRLAQRQSELQQAEAELAIEEGRQVAARADYEYLDEKLPGDDASLVLRKPQLDAAKERVKAARAAVAQAKLDIRRTRVEAPFDAHILRRDVNVGSQVSTTDTLARLVGMDHYWVAVELPLQKVPWIDVPESADQQGSPVRVRNRTSWPPDTYRTGHVDKLVGALDGDTRMARVLATVPDPLGRDREVADAEDGAEKAPPPLMVGEFVEVTIDGVDIDDVVRLDRDYVREGDTVWTMVDGQLAVKDVEIVVRDAQYAYISGGLEQGDRVVKTNLSTVVEGAPLRLPESASDAE